jgi:hypothetical protein
VRITGQSRPDRGTIDKSMADRDYRMSTYDNALEHHGGGFGLASARQKLQSQPRNLVIGWISA